MKAQIRDCGTDLFSDFPGDRMSHLVHLLWSCTPNKWVRDEVQKQEGKTLERQCTKGSVDVEVVNSG